MTENEAIEILENMYEKYVRDCDSEGEYMKQNFAITEAVEALTEIHQYRAIGTVEEIEPYVRLAEKLNLCDLVRENVRLAKKIQFLEVYEKRLKEYEAIGTVEECREARERQKPKIPNIWGDGYDDDGNMIYDMYDCPNCGETYEIGYQDYKYCPECGQAMITGGVEGD